MIKLKNISKSFFGVSVLKNISLEIYPKEVHVLLGENGAGKSTLMKILSGNYTPDSGEIEFEGKIIKKFTPAEAKKLGICIIHQELSVIDELSVAENIYIGILPSKKGIINYKELENNSKKILSTIGLELDIHTPLKYLTTAQKQMIEIAKALALKSDLIIMDEPTTSLTSKEITKLFEVIETLKSQNKYIVYISHRLEEIKQIGDRITVLRDGAKITSEILNKNSKEELNKQMDKMVTYMVGREIVDDKILSKYEIDYSNKPIFKAQNITRKDFKVIDVNIDIYPNEIFGIAGLVGSGRTEFLESIYGLSPITEKGKIFLYDKKVKIKSPYDAIKLGMALLSENRRESGIFQNFAVLQNIIIIKSLIESKLYSLYGVINHKKELKESLKYKKSVDIKCANINQNISELSGGNQQKVLISRWLSAKSNFFIFDEPTKGIDVGSKREIHNMMRELSENGIGILIVSSDLPELITVCDRIAVFRNGSVSGILKNKDATEENIMKLAIS